MVKKTVVPDAWDDDWESQVDQVTAEAQKEPEPEAPLSKTERLNQHAEANRKIWESAQTPETFHFLEASSSAPPVATNFRPQVKVLSRKPVLAKRNPVTGMAQLGLNDDDDDDDQGDAGKELQLSPEEIREKKMRERDEKQRKYEETRAKIFAQSATSSRGSSPGTVTPPRTDGRHSAQGRGRGRGGASRNNNENRQKFDNRRLNNQAAPGRELYDPNQAPRPGSADQRRSGDRDFAPRGPPVRDDQQAIRSPRGPDGSGRGGFGFAQRGA